MVVLQANLFRKCFNRIPPIYGICYYIFPHFTLIALAQDFLTLFLNKYRSLWKWWQNSLTQQLPIPWLRICFIAKLRLPCFRKVLNFFSRETILNVVGFSLAFIMNNNNNQIIIKAYFSRFSWQIKMIQLVSIPMHFIMEGFFSSFYQSVHNFQVAIKAKVRSPVSRKLELLMYHRKIWKFFKIVVEEHGPVIQLLWRQLL